MTVWSLVFAGAIAGCGGAPQPAAQPPVRAPALVGLLVVDDFEFAVFAAFAELCAMGRALKRSSRAVRECWSRRFPGS
jgi:hypothetical protein